MLKIQDEKLEKTSQKEWGPAGGEINRGIGAVPP